MIRVTNGIEMSLPLIDKICFMLAILKLATWSERGQLLSEEFLLGSGTAGKLSKDPIRRRPQHIKQESELRVATEDFFHEA